MLNFDDIEIIFFVNANAYYPKANALGDLIDTLKKTSTIEKIVNETRYSYMYRYADIWSDAAYSIGVEKLLVTPLYLHQNPPVRLKDQKGIFRLGFFGERNNRTVEALDFKNLIESCEGHRRAIPVAFNTLRPIDPMLPKRIELPRF